MSKTCVFVSAAANIALVKYWGKRHRSLNLPAVPSLSLTLDTFRTRTQVVWDTEIDAVHLGGSPAPARFAARVLEFLDFLSDVVDELGTREQIEYAFKIMEEGTSADRQLATFAETGDLRAVVDQLVLQTAEGVENQTKSAT